MSDAVPLLRVHRGPVVESIHSGSVAVHHDGRLVVAWGDVASPVFLRSSAKPFQALEFVLSGAADAVGATEEELAVACASHGAEEFHVEAVERLLARGRLDGSALLCGAHPPACTRASVALARSGGKPGTLHNNCSGKHAAMVLTARHRGQTLHDYLDPTHPLQVANRRNLALFADMDPADILLGTDGCSAPVFALPLERAARAFARLADPDDGIPAPAAAAARRIVAAMMAHPRMVAWTREGDSALMAAAPGRIVSKLGAEGLQCVAAPGLRWGLALKSADGGSRLRLPLTLAILRGAGILSDAEAATVGPAAATTLLNHRALEVGRLEVVLPGPVPRATPPR